MCKIAPAVRVGLGECFGLKPGEITTGQIAAALRRLGFDQVYDTSFAADLTVVEEGTEFLKRKQEGGKLPMFTSCCPGWVKYAEQYFPDLLPNLSTCRSPQAMFGSLIKAMAPEQLKVDRKHVKVVAIMPCTAKKFEAQRPELGVDGDPDVDHVLTTQELAHMIQSAGLIFNTLETESFDMPFGFYTGAGVIFGNSGGVMEAVLRYAGEKLKGGKLDRIDFQEVRGESGMREASITVDGTELKLAVVHGLQERARGCRAGAGGQVRLRLDRSDGVPGWMHRRRRPAGDAQRTMRVPSGPRGFMKPTRCCNCTSRRTTSSSPNVTQSSWAISAAKKRITCCTRATRAGTVSWTRFCR